MPGFPQFVQAPPTPRQNADAELSALMSRARRAQMRLAQLYTGEVYRILHAELQYWLEGGHVFDKGGRARALIDQILTTPVPPRDLGA